VPIIKRPGMRLISIKNAVAREFAIALPVNVHVFLDLRAKVADVLLAPTAAADTVNVLV
jgi:hypothetical protein